MRRLPNESEAYVAARAELLQAEIALKEQVANVAALRRALPEGPTVENYTFREGPSDLSRNAASDMRDVRLSDLFEKPELPLLMVHFMFGGAQETPCPMCSMWADSYNSTARHTRQRANIVICVEGDIETFRSWAAKREWTDIRIVSSKGSSLKNDLKMQNEKGEQSPGLSVFIRNTAGVIHHTYTCEAVLAEGHWNGVDLLSPVWHLFDLLPTGRGDFFPSLEYSD
jgi:predicted dithiol-disulfide oxidoreductase (DUF899 family)